MRITSMSFVLCAAALVVLYYRIPKKWQWAALLCASLGFYAAGGLRYAGYILMTAASTYAATLAMGRVSQKQKAYFAANRNTLTKAEKSEIKKKNNRKKKGLMVAALVLNFGILCVFKYFHFALEQLNHIFTLFGGLQLKDTFTLLVPLGISFYTFQTMGYLVDVYWGKVEPERNFGKLLLFVSFFPQITQGPISSFAQLAPQFTQPHSFTYENYAGGCQRMIWGFFKKMVLANLLAPCVSAVFENYSAYAGPAVLIGMFFYSIQIYADFSGYMDIMCGLCQILDIRLTENFERPYFSKSIAEYWRRWHISLGVWFKNYIYYPIAVSKWNKRVGKWSQKKLGRIFGQALPASIALVVVWLCTGLWHGASWSYIAWGGLNGLFIIVSLWMEPLYAAARKKLHLQESNWFWRAFQVIRTYILVCFIKVLPEVGTLGQGLGLWRQIFTGWNVASFSQLFPYAPGKETLLILFFAMALLFTTSLIQRKTPIRVWFGRFPSAIRALALAGLLFFIVYYGVPASNDLGGFLYAQF